MSSSNNSDSMPAEQAKVPVMANLNHIMGREIVFDEQPPHIQEKLSEISSMEDKLVQLFEKAKACNSVLNAGLTFDYLNLFKEYHVVLHELETELRAQEDTSQQASAEQVERWAKVLYKSSLQVKIIVSQLESIARNVMTYDSSKWLAQDDASDDSSEGLEVWMRNLQLRVHSYKVYEEIHKMAKLISLISEPIAEAYAEMKRVRPFDDDPSLAHTLFDDIWLSDDTSDSSDDTLDSSSVASEVCSCTESIEGS
ncbi:hypothetical protein F5Y06DRAFT_299761 [Hypoxylon sp. FL0890]|nr:hypothetical protein F5Y06DRAFT_299761 [Hypoxylon sp. FL0890]